MTISGKHLERGHKFFLTDLLEANVLQCSNNSCKLSPMDNFKDSIDTFLISPKETGISLVKNEAQLTAVITMLG